jgi:cysteine-rich repeat protein
MFHQYENMKKIILFIGILTLISFPNFIAQFDLLWQVGDVAFALTCGDGILDAREECDDGNNNPGDCCAADCTFESAGSTCGDPSNTECNNPDSCNGAGTCEPNNEAALCGGCLRTQ